MRFLRKPLESFDMARVRLGGDCEDLAREILLEARELQQLVGVSGAVREMQLLAKRFVFAMILGGVSSPEINGDYGQSKEMGAHMWAMMVPRTLWRYWWSRGNGPSAPLPEHDAVPLVLEGTGFLYPESVGRATVAQEEQTQALLQAGGHLSDARKWFSYQHGKRNKFYNTCQIAFTDEYLQDECDSCTRHVCFAVCKPGTQGDPTVGVEFDATVRGDLEQVLLWSEPAINQQELECIRDNLRNAHPMPPLVRNNSSIEQPANNASWVQQQKQLQARLDELIQQQENTIQPGAGEVEIEFFVTAVLLRIDKVVAACRDAGVVLQAQVSIESLCPGLISYRILLRCRSLPPHVMRQRVDALRRRRALEASSAVDEEEF